MRLKIFLAAVIITGCSLSPLFAFMVFDGPNSSYGKGAHAFFSGDYEKAYDELSEAVDAKTIDPRVYLFRGLALRRMGRIDASEKDFQQGARLEVSEANYFFDVNKSLRRVQGKERIAIEQARRVARIEARRSLRRRTTLRYEATRSQEGRVLRKSAPLKSVTTFDKVEPEPAVSDKKVEPKEEPPTLEVKPISSKNIRVKRLFQAFGGSIGTAVKGSVPAVPGLPGGGLPGGATPAAPAMQPSGSGPFDSDPFSDKESDTIEVPAQDDNPFGAAQPAAASAVKFSKVEAQPQDASPSHDLLVVTFPSQEKPVPAPAPSFEKVETVAPVEAVAGTPFEAPAATVIEEPAVEELATVEPAPAVEAVAVEKVVEEVVEEAVEAKAAPADEPAMEAEVVVAEEPSLQVSVEPKVEETVAPTNAELPAELPMAEETVQPENQVAEAAPVAEPEEFAVEEKPAALPEPVAEEPTTVAPAVEELAVEEPVPVEEKPVATEPVAQEVKPEEAIATLAPETPVEETLKPKETPVPAIEELAVEEPAVEEPAIEAPAPAIEEKKEESESVAISLPGLPDEESAVVELAVEEPVIEELAVEKPIAQEPAVEKLVVEEPVPAIEEEKEASESVVISLPGLPDDEPAPVTETPKEENESVVISLPGLPDEEPVAEEPVIEAPVAEKLVTEKPVVEKLATTNKQPEPVTPVAVQTPVAAAEVKEKPIETPAPIRTKKNIHRTPSGASAIPSLDLDHLPAEDDPFAGFFQLPNKLGS